MKFVIETEQEKILKIGTVIDDQGDFVVSLNGVEVAYIIKETMQLRLVDNICKKASNEIALYDIDLNVIKGK